MKTAKCRELPPSVSSLAIASRDLIPSSGNRYKIGDSFFSLTLPEVQELVAASTSKIEEDVEKVEAKLNGLREEMSELKVALYGRFGRSINLET
jgi:chaperonin cofactor prefoldin